jgi:hypothetical protein
VDAFEEEEDVVDEEELVEESVELVEVVVFSLYGNKG